VKLDTAAFVGNPELVAALKVRSRTVECTEDRVLFVQGETPTGLFILEDGEVHLTMRSPEGELVMNERAEPGSLLGLPGVICNQGYSLSAYARKGAAVRFVGREEFSRLMLNEPGMAMLILRVLAAEVRTARIAAANA
jgi:CRP-like cAMP-binding protein